MAKYIIREGAFQSIMEKILGAIVAGRTRQLLKRFDDPDLHKKVKDADDAIQQLTDYLKNRSVNGGE